MSRIVRITPSFLAEVAKAETDHPGSKGVILHFLDNRRKNAVWQGYGAKDARLKGILDDTWHFHIVHGTVLLFYQISETSLDAYCLRNHTYVEMASKQKALRKTLDAVHAGDFLAFDVDAVLRPPPPQAPRMDPDELSTLKSMIYDLLARNTDREAVEAAASGMFDQLRTYVCMLAEHEVEPPGFWDACIDGFGGDAAFRVWLTAAIAQIPSAST